MTDEDLDNELDADIGCDDLAKFNDLIALEDDIEDGGDIILCDCLLNI